MAEVEEFDPLADFRAGVFLQRCRNVSPKSFWFIAISATAALSATLVMCLRHTRRLDSRPVCMLRTYYRSMLIFPMVWAICSWATLCTPLSYPLAELFMGQSEAYAIYAFLVILFMLVTIEAQRKQPEQEDVTGHVLVQAIQGYGPQKYFAVPPVCCLLRRCMRAHQITARQLVWVSRFVRQYGLLQIILNSFLLWARLTLKPREAEATEQLASVVLKISGVLAVYGLFVMYKATHDLLDDWNTTRKFVSVKLLVGLSAAQGMIMAFIVCEFPPAPTNCLVPPHHPQDTKRMRHFWASYVTLLETTILARLITQAFPAEEVVDYKLKNLDYMELELRQIYHHARAGRMSLVP